MRCPLEREVEQIGQGELSPSDIEMAPGELPAKNGGHLEVDQFRSSEVFATKPRPGFVAVRTVVSQRDGKDARVNDEHAQTGACSPML